jgi:hypothetical protein
MEKRYKSRSLLSTHKKSLTLRRGVLWHVIADGRKVTVCRGENKKWKRFLRSHFHTSNVSSIRNISLKETCVLEVPTEKTCLTFIFLNNPSPAVFGGETITQFVLKRLPALFQKTEEILPLLGHATLAIHDGRIYPAESPVGKLLKRAAENNVNPSIAALMKESLGSESIVKI